MRRKGISPIISSVLVLAVAVSIASIYGGWAPDFTRNLTSRFSQSSMEDIKCQNAGLDIRNAQYDESDKDLIFDLQNTGTIRFPGEINLAALNRSRIIAQKTVKGLGVEESLEATITTDQEPDEIIASPTDCSEITAEERFINVTS